MSSADNLFAERSSHRLAPNRTWAAVCWSIGTSSICCFAAFGVEEAAELNIIPRSVSTKYTVALPVVDI